MMDDLNKNSEKDSKKDEIYATSLMKCANLTALSFAGRRALRHTAKKRSCDRYKFHNYSILRYINVALFQCCCPGGFHRCCYTS